MRNQLHNVRSLRCIVVNRSEFVWILFTNMQNISQMRLPKRV